MMTPEDANEMGRTMSRDHAIRSATQPLEARITRAEEKIARLEEIIRRIGNACGKSGAMGGGHW